MDLSFGANPARASKSNFNNAVHALRAFATLMVFCAHMFDSFNTYFFSNCDLLNLAIPYIKRFGTFGVELFFVISGYVIMNSVSRYDLLGFFRRRLIRIYPVFAFFTILFFAINSVYRLAPGKMSVADFLLNMTFLDIYFGTPALSPNAWSLSYEANFYVLAGIGCCLLKERLARAFALLLLAATVFLIFFPIAAYFVIGCLLYFARNLLPVSVPRGVQSAVIVAWCVLAATIDHAPATFELQSLMMNVVLLAFTTVFFVVVSSRTGAFAWLATLKPIFFIGTISYSFYLTHPYSYFALRVLFQKLGLETWNIGAAAAVYFPSMTLLAIAVSYLVYRVLEVAPYRAAFGESVFRERTAVDSAANTSYSANKAVRPATQT